MHNRIIYGTLSVFLAFAGDGFAQTLNGPDYIPPFLVEKTERQIPELKINSFLWQGKSAEQPSFISGNKRVSPRDFNGNMRADSDTRLPFYINNKLAATVAFDGAFQIGGKWSNIVLPVKETAFVCDPQKQRVVYTRPWKGPDGKSRNFSYMLQPDGPGKLKLSWSTGCSPEDYLKFRKENSFNWNIIASAPDTVEPEPVLLNGKAILRKRESDFAARKTVRSWKGAVSTVEVKQITAAVSGIARIEFGRECVLEFPGYGGAATETAYLEKGAKTGYGIGFRLGPSKNEPGGSLIFNFGKTAVKKADVPPPVEGHDLYAQDALHMPHSPTRNLFPNPSFEQGMRYWRWCDGGGRYTPSKTLRYTVDDNGLFGKKALVINPVQHGVVPPMSFSLPGKKGETYTVSFYARAEKPGSSAGLTLFSRKQGGQFGRPYMEKDTAHPVGTEWKRYSQSFVSDGAPVALVVKGGGPGKVWIDGIQYERGKKATEFVAPPMEGCLFTSDPDNNVEAGKPMNAGLAFHGMDGVSGKAELTLFDFFKKVIWRKTYEIKAGEKLNLPWDTDRLQNGLFVLRVKYEIPGTKPYFDFYRFSILKSLRNDFATKDLYGNSFSARIGRTEDFLNLMRRCGYGGSASYGAGRESNPVAYELRKKYGITDYTHTLVDGIALSREERRQRMKNPDFKLLMELRRGWLTEEEKKNYKPILRYTPEILKRVEELAYRATKANPEVRVWSFATEEECVIPSIIERNFDEFAKLQLAFHKGIRRGSPAALVMPTGGTSGFGKTRGADIIEGYLKATQGKVKWDAIPAHPYGAIDGTDGNGELEESIQILSSIMKKYGYGKDTPIYFNEGFGLDPVRWGDGPDYTYTGGQPSYDMGLWEFLHAGKLARLFLICLKYPQVRHFNAWQGDSRTLVDYNLAIPASMKAVNTLANLLGNPKFVDDIRPAAGMRGYAFEQNGKGVAAVWCTQDDVERGFQKGPVMRVRFSGKLPELVDLMGRGYPVKAEKDGSVYLQLSPAPLFVCGENAHQLADDLKRAEVIGAGASVNVSFQPELNGAVSAKVANLTGREQRGSLELPGRKIEFNVPAGKSDGFPADAPAKPEFGRIYRWNRDYSLAVSGTAPVAKTWKMDYFYVPHVNGAPDWNRIPAIPISNMYRPVMNLKQAPGGHKGDISAQYKVAWNKENLYLRVEVEDDDFNVGNPQFWNSPQAQKTQLYLLDGCLEVYIDCGANGRLGNGGFDLDDYRYDFCAGNPEGKSGPGKVCRQHEVYIEYGLGINMATKEEAARKIKCEFERISKTKYAYTVTFGQRYLEPMRLRKGTLAGFGLYIHDADGGRPCGDKGLSTATEPGAHCNFSPHLWPLMILAE